MLSLSVLLAGVAFPAADPLPPGAVARLGGLKLRHASYVAAVAYSPDGRLLASGSNTNYGGTDGTLRVWDVATGAERWRAAHEVTAVAWAPDGKTVASGGRDGAVRLWDVATGRQSRQIAATEGGVYGLAIAPGGKTLASVSSNSNAVRLWDVATGTEVRQLVADGRELSAVAFSPDGKTVVAGGGSWAKTTLWDAATGERIRTFGGPQIPGASTLAFSPDGTFLATADGEIRLYEVSTGRFVRKLGDHRTDVSANKLAFSPDGKTLALGSSGGTLVLWDLAADREARTFTVRGGYTGGVAYSPDGKHFAWGGYGNTVRMWEAATGTELHTDRAHLCDVRYVGFGPAGEVLTGADTLRAWDVGPNGPTPDGRQGVPLPGWERLGLPLAVSPDRRTAVIGGWGWSVGPRLVDLTSGVAGERFDLPANAGAVDAAFTPDGKQVVTVGHDHTLTLWDVGTGKEVRRFVGHGSRVNALAISPDGKLLASGDSPGMWARMPRKGAAEDAGIRLWAIETGAELRHIPVLAGTLAFSPDGRLLAAGGDFMGAEGLRLFDPASGAEVRALTGPRLGPYRVAFAPDSKTLTSVGRDKMVRLWDVATGRERLRYDGHTGEVYAVAYSPDGTRLVTGGADGTALVWDASRSP